MVGKTMARMSSFYIPLLLLLLPFTQSLQFSHFPVTAGRADSVLDPVGSVRPTGRPGVPGGEQALLALLESGDFTTEGSARDFTTDGNAEIVSESEKEEDRSKGRDDHDDLRYRDSHERQSESVDQDVSKKPDDHVRSRYSDWNISSSNTIGQTTSISINRSNPSKLKHRKDQSRSKMRVSQEKSRNGNDFIRSQNVASASELATKRSSEEGYNMVMHVSEEERDGSTSRHDRDELRYSDSRERLRGSIDQEVFKNRADQIRLRYHDGNAISTNTVGQIKSNSRNSNNPSQSRQRSNIGVSQERARNGNDSIRPQNVVVSKKSRGDVRSRKVKNQLRKSHKQVNIMRHVDDRENPNHIDMHAKSRLKLRLSPKNILDDLLKSAPSLANHGIKNAGSLEQTTKDSILMTKFALNKGKKGQAKPSKTIAISHGEVSIPKPTIQMERNISKTGNVIANTKNELLKQGIHVSNTSVMNQIARKKKYRKKINGKERSFNEKERQTFVDEIPRKNERNIRIRVHNKQNKTEYNEKKEKDENSNRNRKLNENNKYTGNEVSKHMSPNPRNDVRPDPLLRILKKTNARTKQDKFFLPTASPDTKVSNQEHKQRNQQDKELVIHQSITRDPVLRILKAVKSESHQETVDLPQKIEKQRKCIKHINIDKNIEAQIHENKSEYTTDFDPPRDRAIQESMTKRRNQQKKNISDRGFKPLKDNNTINNFSTQKETNSKSEVTSGEEKSIKRMRNKGRARNYDEQQETNSGHLGERLGLISEKLKTENLLLNESGGSQGLVVGHVTENKYAFSTETTKNRERAHNEDDNDSHPDNIKIDLTKFESNKDEKEVTKTEAEVPFYDIEKALKHAEITWAQDPFRKESSLPGKPTFDIDFSKNPAEQKKHKTNVNIPSEKRDSQKQIIVKGAFNPSTKHSKSDEDHSSKDKELELLVFNSLKSDPTTNPRHEMKRYDPPHESLLKESATYASSTVTKEENKFSIEDLTWTPALLRGKLDLRKTKQTAF